jgi:hypothetical protein
MGTMTRRVADRLRQARRRRFVGRAGEIELFSGALAAPDESFSVLFLHGPGGVGKSALLGELAETARQAGAVPVGLDARTVQRSPSGILSALAGELGLAEGESPLDALGARDRNVVLLDTYELLAPLDDWVRERFLPGLPGDTLIVIAGRNRPSSRWASDPGWRELLRVVSLRNLRPDDTRAYLQVEGVPESLHEQVMTMTHGHPLTLSLLVETIARDSGRSVPQVLADAPDVVRALLGRVVDEAPSGRHRNALEVCAHVRFTTEELLRAGLGGDDAHELFGWLRTLSFVEEGPHGVYPHDVARDVLDADLRWRDRVGYADLHRRLRAHFVKQARQAGDEQDRQHGIADIMFLSRTHPITRDYFEFTGLGQAYTDALRPSDAAAVLAMTREYQGEEQAALVAYWLDRQPQGFLIFRDAAGEPLGYGTYLALHRASQADLDGDPGTRAIWEYAQRHGPPRPGELVMAWRFFVDTEPHQRPSRSETQIRLWHGKEIITRTGCAWDFLAVHSDPDYWEPMFTYFDYHLAPEAGFEIGGRPYDVFAHDWRRLGVDQWLELTADRELGAPVTQPTGTESELVLSQPEFAEAVRAALRDLNHRERLAGNPLLRSQMVRAPGSGGDRPAAEILRGLIGEATESLRGDSRDEPLFRVVDRTFLRPAPTQERAAEMLGLPFSTFRRYRNRGVEHVIAWLWRRELYGSDTVGERGHQVDSDWPGG